MNINPFTPYFYGRNKKISSKKYSFLTPKIVSLFTIFNCFLQEYHYNVYNYVENLFITSILPLFRMFITTQFHTQNVYNYVDKYVYN